MAIETVLLILLIHWIGDFLLQTEYQETNKSVKADALFAHVAIYSAFTACAWGWMTSCSFGEFSFVFTFTLVAHLITDYFTSRWNKRAIPERANIVLRDPDGTQRTWFTFPLGEKYHRFFAQIGFDQLLHYAQLFLMYRILFL